MLEFQVRFGTNFLLPTKDRSQVASSTRDYYADWKARDLLKIGFSFLVGLQTQVYHFLSPPFLPLSWPEPLSHVCQGHGSAGSLKTLYV